MMMMVQRVKMFLCSAIFRPCAWVLSLGLALCGPVHAVQDKADEKEDETSERQADDAEKRDDAGKTSRPRVRIIRRLNNPDRYADPMLSAPIAPTLDTGVAAPAVAEVVEGSSLAPPPEVPQPSAAEIETAAGVRSPETAARPSFETGTAQAAGWYVQVGAFASPIAARRRLESARDLIGGGFNDIETRVALADISGAALYRARFAGLSEGRAVALCERLRAGGVDCFAADSGAPR